MIETRGKRKVRMGRVTSDASEKTITVSIDRTFRHPLYSRVVRSKKKLYVHDENTEAMKAYEQIGMAKEPYRIYHYPLS